MFGSLVATCAGLLAAAALLAGTAVSVAAPTPMPDIPRVDNVNVQNNVVSDWHDQGLVIHALAGTEATLPPASEFSAVARLGWNDEGLLLQVAVTDATPEEVDDAARLFDGDSVDIQLMTAGKTEGLVQAIGTPGRTPTQPKPRALLMDYRAQAFKAATPTVQPRVAATKTDKGYVLDMILPWANLKFTPHAGDVIGLRIGVADHAGRQVNKAIFTNGRTETPWMNLPPVRLSGKPGNPAPASATWGGYEGYSKTYVNVVANPDQAGKSVEVKNGDEVVASGKLAEDGPRAVAALTFPAPPLGKTFSQLDVQLAGTPIGTINLPDLNDQRLRAFLSGGNAGGRGFFRRGGGGNDLRPTTKSTVFSGDAFPTFAYPNPQAINDLVGSYSMSTAYFDARGNRAAKPTAPGRYGAMTQVIDGAGDSFTLYTTLYKLADGETAPPDASAEQLAAAREHPDGDVNAMRADRDWWHAVRKTLNTAIQYEYVVSLPKGYDNDQTKKWPLIIYMHGSGGGNNPRDVRDNGPQIAARTKSDFPFIVVSLRSPGGWDPPAVEDVIDDVAKTCRTDPTRYYLTGFSMGGAGTWNVAMDNPQRFAAIVPIASRGSSVQAAQVLKDMPMWVINGSEDRGTATPAERSVEALKAAGFNVKWSLIQGADHVQSHVIAYSWDDLYKWMLEHHR